MTTLGLRQAIILPALPGIAPLAHGSSAASAAFNATFYVAAAAIIPVLFLALAVQGNAYQKLIRASADVTRAYSRTMVPLAEAGQLSALEALVGSFIVSMPALVALLVLFYGSVCEIVAIIALYQQHASALAGEYVVGGLIFLTIAVAAGPAGALGKDLLQGVLEDRLAAKARKTAPAGPGTPADGTSRTPPEPAPDGLGAGRK
jgi:hypothetical protein